MVGRYDTLLVVPSAMLNRLAEPITRNRFLGSLNVNKYELCALFMIEIGDGKARNGGGGGGCTEGALGGI
jgi:hypothetical protein